MKNPRTHKSINVNIAFHKDDIQFINDLPKKLVNYNTLEMRKFEGEWYFREGNILTLILPYNEKIMQNDR